MAAGYVSDHTRFINEWLEQHPEERVEQQKGRALWWDHPQTEETRQVQQASSVPTKAYYYDINH